MEPLATNWLGQEIFAGDFVLRQTQSSYWEQKLGKVLDNGYVLWFARCSRSGTVWALDLPSRIPVNTNLGRLVVIPRESLDKSLLDMIE